MGQQPYTFPRGESPSLDQATLGRERLNGKLPCPVWSIIVARTRKAISVANLNNVSPRSVYAELVEASHFFLRPCVTPRRKVQPFDKLRVGGLGLDASDLLVVSGTEN